MANIYSIKENVIEVDDNKMSLNSWLGEEAKAKGSDKPAAPKKQVRFASPYDSGYESGTSSNKTKPTTAKTNAPQVPKPSSFAARPKYVVNEAGVVKVVPPRTNMFYEMGTVSGAVANFAKNLLIGVVGVAQKVVEVALMALRRLVAVPASIIGSAVGAIVGLFSPRSYDSGLYAAAGSMTGMSLSFKVEKALNAVVKYALAAPLKGAAYGLSAAVFVAALPVSILASPIVAVVKNANR